MPTSRSPFRADLEALRGVAVLLVVAYHAGVPALAGGFVGVDVLFVMSGFFTTRLLLQEYAATGTVDVAAFYGRRARRLLPALVVVLVATLAAVWALYAPIDRAAVAATARSVVLGTANHDFARQSVNYFADAQSPLLHTWTLAVEQQVSLFAPLLFLALVTVGGWSAAARARAGSAAGESSRRATALLRGVGIGVAVTAAVSLGISIWLTGSSPSWAFFGTPSRVWEFAVGGLLALVLPGDATPSVARPGDARRTGWWLQVAGLLAIALAVLVYDRATPYPGVAALLPVLAAAALVAGGARGRGALESDHRALRGLRWFGRLSYNWYLWHWPVLVTALVLFPAMGPWARLAWCAAALAPAWLTHRWVERPLRAAPGESAARETWWPLAAVAACVAVAVGTGALRGAARQRVAAPDQRPFAAARRDRMPHECWARDGTLATPRGGADACVFGDPEAATTVALFGDSHAEHWLAALDSLGRARGWRVVLMVKGGCPVADAPELIGPRARRGRECAAYREAATRSLIANRPAVAVLASWDEYVARGRDDAGEDGRVSPAAWRRGLRRTYARLAGAGVPVVVMRGSLHVPFDVPACLSRRADGRPLAQPCTFARDEALHAPARAAQLAAVRDVAARGLPVRAVDLTDRICATSSCGAMRDGRVLFTDDNHLTASFTRASAGVVGARLDRALASMGVRLP